MEDWRQSQKVFSRLGWCYIAGTVAVYGLQFILVCGIRFFRPEWLTSMTVILLLSGFTMYACGMPLIVLLAYRMPKTDIPRHKMKWWQFLLALIMCYSLVYVSNLVGTLVTTLMGLFTKSSVENQLIEYVTDGNMLLNFILMVVVAPIVEEYVFRKVIVDRTVRYGQGVAIVASGLMFGLFHGNLNQFAYAVVLGAFFAFLYVKTGNLKITIAMHAIINFMGSVVAGQLIRMLNYNELKNVDPSDMELMAEIVMDNLGAWVLYLLYLMVLLVVVIAGVILFIVFFKRFKFDPQPMQIPKGKRFQMLFLNPGMLTFCALWIVLIILPYATSFLSIFINHWLQSAGFENRI